jgi:hypothetical protein
MGSDRPRRGDEFFAGQSERIRRELRDSGIPVFVLSDATKPTEEVFGGQALADDAVVSVQVVYPGAAWVNVETARRAWSGTLPVLVEQHMRRRGDRLTPVEWSEHDAQVIVDGEPVAARMVRAGSRWWALRCERDGVAISVTARDWHPETIAVQTLTDVLPMLSRLGAPPAEPPGRAPEDLGREPHRALTDIVLRAGREHAEWRAAGGVEPQLPRSWTARWQAAVSRQIDLTDQAEPDARQAVSDMVSQLTNLQENAAWFRTDSDLRERAIAETLLWGTGLSDTVASRPAQLAWQRHHRIGTEWEAWAAALGPDEPGTA